MTHRVNKPILTEAIRKQQLDNQPLNRSEQNDTLSFEKKMKN